MQGKRLETELKNEIEQLKQSGLYNNVREIGSPQGSWIVVDGRRLLNLSSNNYLGLADEDILKKAACDLVEAFGTGSGAVRSIAGDMSIYRDLERALAEFKEVEAVALFQSGFLSNIAVIPAITGKDDVIISDELNHASIIDGCRLSKARTVRYKHLDMTDLSRVLEETRDARRQLIITDGVFSMDGEIAPLPDMVKIKDSYGAILMVDDSHGEGVLGDHGRGVVNHFGLHGKVEIEVGTLSKAFGIVGGFVAASKEVIEYLKQRARPFLFSTPISPGDAGAALAAVHLMSNNDSRIKRLWENTRYFKRKVEELGFNTGNTSTPIIPLMVGNEEKAQVLSSLLMERGVFIQAIVYPTVPRGTARLRTMISAVHSREDLDYAIKQLADAGRETGIL